MNKIIQDPVLKVEEVETKIYGKRKYIFFGKRPHIGTTYRMGKVTWADMIVEFSYPVTVGQEHAFEVDDVLYKVVPKSTENGITVCKVNDVGYLNDW